ncbi:MAG: hypothetical protein JWM47_2519 [Acidimicrobiales bacterium]|nr:hypothetical protein [Acidimicrobiales bacterium]
MALGVYLATVIVRWAIDPAGLSGTGVRVIGAGALVWWAVDEVARGVNPFRRGLGAVVLAVTVAGLVGAVGH